MGQGLFRTDLGSGTGRGGTSGQQQVAPGGQTHPRATTHGCHRPSPAAHAPRELRMMLERLSRALRVQRSSPGLSLAWPRAGRREQAWGPRAMGGAGQQEAGRARSTEELSPGLWLGWPKGQDAGSGPESGGRGAGGGTGTLGHEGQPHGLQGAGTVCRTGDQDSGQEETAAVLGVCPHRKPVSPRSCW